MLSSHAFNQDNAVAQFKNYLQWRQKQNIQTILVSTDSTRLIALVTELRILAI
jgi:hypothetical protein